VFSTMTSVYCVSPVQYNTLTPFFQSVFHHQMSTLISSKSALTPASEEHLFKVCVIHYFSGYILLYFILKKYSLFAATSINFSSAREIYRKMWMFTMISWGFYCTIQVI